MKKQILVPIDYSEVSRDVIQLADEWAQRMNAEILFLYVTHKGELPGENPLPSPPQPYSRTAEESVRQEHEELKDFVEYGKIASPYRTLHGIGKPYTQILAAEKEYGVDLIMMAAHDHTALGRILLGSNTDFVSHYSHCPLYVYKKFTQEWSNKILLPIDFSEVNKPVVKFADELAIHYDAELIFLNVGQDTNDSYGDGKMSKVLRVRTADSYLTQFVESVGVKAYYDSIALPPGKSYVEILKTQKRLNPRLIMMAAHSHTVAERWFKGSNTDYLLHHANCPMYVFKTGE